MGANLSEEAFADLTARTQMHSTPVATGIQELEPPPWKSLGGVFSGPRSTHVTQPSLPLLPCLLQTKGPLQYLVCRTFYLFQMEGNMLTQEIRRFGFANDSANGKIISQERKCLAGVHLLKKKEIFLIIKEEWKQF